MHTEYINEYTNEYMNEHNQNASNTHQTRIIHASYTHHKNVPVDSIFDPLLASSVGSVGG